MIRFLFFILVVGTDRSRSGKGHRRVTVKATIVGSISTWGNEIINILNSSLTRLSAVLSSLVNLVEKGTEMS